MSYININKKIIKYSGIGLMLITTAMGVSSAAATTGQEIYGRYEHVLISEFGNAKFKGKLDTGARTASLHAEDITIFKRNGADWVRFTTEIKKKKGSVSETYELPIVKVSKIKQRLEEVEEVSDSYDNNELHDNDESLDDNIVERPVVRITMCMGNYIKEIDVNLTNRSNFKYPLLIGAKALGEFNALVDAKKRYTHKPKCK